MFEEGRGVACSFANRHGACNIKLYDHLGKGAMKLTSI